MLHVYLMLFLTLMNLFFAIYVVEYDFGKLFKLYIK